MAHYTKHTFYAGGKYYCRFTCEHCGKDTGWLFVNVVTNSEVSTSGYNTTLAAGEAEKINTGLQTGVKAQMEYIKARTEKGRLSGIGLDGKCPHCEMLQSWALGDQAKWIGYSALFGWLICSSPFLAYGMAFNKMKEITSLYIGATVLGPIAGLIFGLVRYFTRRNKILKSNQRNKPEFCFDFPQGVTEKDMKYGGEKRL